MNRSLMLILIVALIVTILFTRVNLFAAEPSITIISGTVSNGNTITASGSNFGTRFNGDAVFEYFDNFSAENQWGTNDQNIGGEGYFETSFSASDIDNMTPGGSYDQVASLGWGVAIRRGAACFSTGYGYRRSLGAVAGGLSSGDNYGISATFSAESTIWVSFLMRKNPAHVDWDSNVDFCDGNLDNHTWMEKIFRVRGNDGGTYAATQYLNTAGWTSGDACGSHLYYRWQDDNGNWPKYPVYNSSKYPGRDCADYKPHYPTGKWFRVLTMMKFDTGGDGELEIYMDKGAGELLLYNPTGRTTNVDAGDWVKFGGNHSNTQDTWLTSDQDEISTYDYDDIMVSTTKPDPPACIFLSNSSTWGAGVADRWNGDATFVRQKVGGSDSADYGFKSWSNTEFKFEVNLSDIDTYKPVYLYVTSWNGETNSSGYHLVEGFPPAAPTGVEVK